MSVVNKILIMKTSISKVKKKITPVLKRYNVKRAAIFGSFVRKEAKKDSDIDILIEFKDKNNKSLFDLIDLQLELEEKLRRKVDVLTYDSLHPLLKNRILKEQKAIL